MPGGAHGALLLREDASMADLRNVSSRLERHVPLFGLVVAGLAGDLLFYVQVGHVGPVRGGPPCDAAVRAEQHRGKPRKAGAGDAVGALGGGIE